MAPDKKDLPPEDDDTAGKKGTSTEGQVDPFGATLSYMPAVNPGMDGDRITPHERPDSSVGSDIPEAGTVQSVRPVDSEKTPPQPQQAVTPDGRIRAADTESKTAPSIISLGGIDTSVPKELLDSLRDVSGGEACAILGIERDNLLRGIPPKACVLDGRIELTKTYTPERVFASVKQAIAEMGGVFLDSIWSGPGELRFHALFPNLVQAHNAAFKMSKGNKKAASSFGAVEDQGYVSTFKGNIFSWGPAFQNAMFLNRETTPGLRIKRREAAQPITAKFERELDVPEVQYFSQQHVNKESVTHALSLSHLQPGLTQKCVLMIAELPEYIDGNGIIDREKLVQIKKIVDELSGRGVRMSLKGNMLIAAVGIENAPGNTLLRFEKTLRTVEEMGMKATLSFGGVTFQNLDDHSYAPHSPDFYGVLIPPRPGLWMEREFEAQKNHPRNRSIARTIDGEVVQTERNSLTRIKDVRPIDYEVEIGGPSKTIGRDREISAIRDNVDRTMKSGRCQITIVEGEGGIGKTRLAVEAMGAARDRNMPSLYCKQIEEDRNESGAYIKKLIKGVLQQYPDLKEDFRDLEFFAEGTVPPGFAQEYAGKVKVLSKMEFLSPRFLKLMERAPELSPGQVILDDLHWLDPFSTAVLVQWIYHLREQSALSVYVVGREGEDNIPKVLLDAIQGKGSMCTRMKVGRLDFAGSPELLEEYVRNTPGIRGDAKIPPSFLQELAAISEGHPFCLTETLESLLSEGEISYDEHGFMVVGQGAMRKLQKGNLSATLSSLLQAKFDRLTPEEREIADYLVTVGEISRDLFVSLLRFQFAQQGPKKVETVLTVLDSLREKGIVRFTPFGFTHDLLRSQREAALGGERGDLALQSAMVYKPLRMVYHDPRGRELLTPQMLFGILNRAFERVDVLSQHFTPDAMHEFLSEFQTLGKEAAVSSLNKNDNENAKAIIEKILQKLEASIMAKIIRKPEDGGVSLLERLSAKGGAMDKLIDTNYLFKIYLLGAEALTRLGAPQQASVYLQRIEALNRLVPDAQILGDERALKYHVLRTKVAFASKSMPLLQQAQGELRAALALVDPDGTSSDRDVVIARGELALADIRVSNNMDQIIHDSAESKTILMKLHRDALAMRDEELAMEVQALIKDITRATIQKRSFLVISKNSGMDPSTLFMQDIKGDPRAEMMECLGTLEKIKKDYEDNPYLIRDPQAYGYLYDTIARLNFLVGKQEESQTAIAEGIRISRNQELLEVVARLHKLEGDIMIGGVLKGHFTDVQSWDPERLKLAIESYQRGISEISRVDKNAPYVRLCAINQGFATGLYALRLSETEPLDPAKREELERLLTAVWTQMLEALAKTREASMRDGQPGRDYLHELATLGLLKEAGAKLRIQLKLPQTDEPNSIDLFDAKDEERFLGEQMSEIEKSPDRYSSADRGLTELRIRGISSLVH